MHVISRKKLREFASAHPDAATALDGWYRIAKRANWPHFAAVRADFPSTDLVGNFVVFNVGGNKYRLIAEVVFPRGKVYVRHILTHKEYDRGDWKSP